MTVDTEGRIYMATTLGIQVFDQLGKCHGILRLPGEGRATAVTFSGPGVQPSDRAARRPHLRAPDQGDRRAVVDETPVTPPAPRLWRAASR